VVAEARGNHLSFFESVSRAALAVLPKRQSSGTNSRVSAMRIHGVQLRGE
jgi:hypothetical protein